MNRENKRQKYEKGYYKTHPCTDSFTCKVCGRCPDRGCNIKIRKISRYLVDMEREKMVHCGEERQTAKGDWR